MSKVYWFNPCNDMALAANVAPYEPPRAAKAFARGGSALPLWWAENGDVVFGEADECLIERWRDRYGLEGEMSLDLSGAERVEPWGWSRDAVWRLQKAGMPASVLPDEKSLDRIRQLSHRRTALEVSRLCGLPDIGIEAFHRDEAISAIRKFDGAAFVKNPWSSSGRGVFAVKGLSEAKLLQVIDGSIRHMGSVIIEPAWQKNHDFALLLSISHGKISHEGWSWFESHGGRYQGNLVASQEEIAEKIPREAHEWAPQVINSLEQIIREDYEGLLGVDMLSTPQGRVNPCVEVNLRRTMGFVARNVWRKTGSRILLSDLQNLL